METSVAYVLAFSSTMQHTLTDEVRKVENTDKDVNKQKEEQKKLVEEIAGRERLTGANC